MRLDCSSNKQPSPRWVDESEAMEWEAEGMRKEKAGNEGEEEEDDDDEDEGELRVGLEVKSREEVGDIEKEEGGGGGEVDTGGGETG